MKRLMSWGILLVALIVFGVVRGPLERPASVAVCPSSPILCQPKQETPPCEINRCPDADKS